MKLHPIVLLFGLLLLIPSGLVFFALLPVLTTLTVATGGVVLSLILPVRHWPRPRGTASGPEKVGK